MPRDHDYHSLRVTRVVEETAEARSFVFDVPRELEPIFAYTSGQYCTFRATVGAETLVRCYSMSSAPAVGEPLTVTVKRVPGGRMSNWMNDELTAGRTIDVLCPNGSFVLVESGDPVVAFAAGSGITPILSIVKTALATTRRRVRLVYANRDAPSILFAAELERLQASAPGRLDVHHHLDAEGGFLDARACAHLVGEDVAADFYVCGPAPFMAVVEAGLVSRGVEGSRIRVEHFEADESDGADEEPIASATASLVVRLQGRETTMVYHQGDTILAAARRGGLRPPFSCESGHCASCMARLEAGRATMRVNDALTPEEIEEGWVLTCQAYPTSSEVVVDYDA